MCAVTGKSQCPNNRVFRKSIVNTRCTELVESTQKVKTQNEVRCAKCNSDWRVQRIRAK